jgi:hypothetical protein
LLAKIVVSCTEKSTPIVAIQSTIQCFRASSQFDRLSWIYLSHICGVEIGTQIPLHGTSHLKRLINRIAVDVSHRFRLCNETALGFFHLVPAQRSSSDNSMSWN